MIAYFGLLALPISLRHVHFVSKYVKKYKICYVLFPRVYYRNDFLVCVENTVMNEKTTKAKGFINNRLSAIRSRLINYQI